jgi:hypothetical protein
LSRVTGFELWGLLSMRYAFLLPLAMLGSFATPGLSEPAQTPTILALQMLELGQWSLRSRKDPSESRALCIGDARLLFQIRHGSAACSRFVVSNEPRGATVQYNCPGAGQGLTSLKVETARLVQIQSQGVMNNEPFALEFEGRRIGECPTKAASVIQR